MTTMTGRERTPEDIAEEIMNQSGEGLEDLLTGTEITDDESDLDDGDFMLDDDLDISDDSF